jgi:redox-sensitive bicupin YhaK (pirin superfamily)
MPKGDAKDRMGGFQLWANLPRVQKMMDPRYRGITAAEIPAVRLGSGGTVKVICGDVAGTAGPVRDIVTDPEYLDVSLPENATFRHAVKRGHTLFAYIIGGRGRFGEDDRVLDEGTLVAFDREGTSVDVATDDRPVRLLLVSGKPLGEPVAWYGPIVMNTDDELQTAFEEYQRGTFIKHKT